MKQTFIALLVALTSIQLHAQDTSNEGERFDQYGKRVDRTALNAEMRNGVLVFESKNQDYKLWYDIRLQTDGQFFFNDEMNPIGDGFTIRRARFAVKAQLTKNWLAELDLNFSNGVFELEDAIIGYNFNNGLVTRVGNFKEQFSMSQTSSSRYIPFMERAMVVSALAPSRHLGWDATFNHKYFLAAGGVFFQAIEDGEALLNVQDNNKDFGRDQGYSLTGKIVAQPFSYNQNYGLHLGYGYSYRTPKTDVAPGEYGKARYSVRSLSNINRKKYLDTDLIAELKNEKLSNIEVAGFYKGFAFQSELMNNTVARNNTTEALNFGGFYAQATYLLFGGRQIYDKNQGEFNQPDRGKKWGDVELALRYDFINLNDKEVMGGSAEGYTIGLNFYASKNFKLQMNYSYLNHDRYANGKGKLFVGYDLDGNLTKDPTKVADAAGKAGHDYGQFGIRAEINF
jgi:phosphate-selective porin OprO/OprP